jgi:outer membrane immunogenic protein
MKKLATYVVAIAASIGTPAIAADMAVKAPPPAPAPVYNWTGWYAGVNAGASFGRVKTDFNADPVTLGGGAIIIPGFGQSDTLEPSGFIGGGQIGYNWQLSPIWVAGLEADIQGADEKDSASLNRPFSVTESIVPLLAPAITATGTSVLNYTAKIDWFGTVRGRIGYLWGNGAVLTYVTGGLAYGKVELDATTTVSGTAAAIPFSTTHAFSHSQLNTGWTVGLGTEGKLLIPGWTYKIESLYVDLGSDPTTDACLICPSGVSGGLITGHAHFTDAILRAGVNYQFH